MAIVFLFPHTNTVLAGLIPLLLLLYYFLWRSKPSKNIPPPEAGGAWPIIGHLHLLRTSSRLPHITLGAMADKYGPIFTVRIGLKRAVVVSNSEIAKECFTTHDTVILSRPKFIAADNFSYNYAMFGFTPYGAYWREMRKITSLELLGSRRLELLKHVRVSETDTSIKELHKLWTNTRTSSGYVLVEMKKWFADLTLNVVIRMVAGKKYFGATANSDEKEGRRCQKVIRDFMYYMGLFLVADAIPVLRWLDLGGHEKAMKKSFKEIDTVIYGWLEEHRERREPGGGYKGDQDFMDAMLSTLQGTDHVDYDVDTINKATCLVMIVGAEPASVMLTWALSLLMNNRHVLKKAQEELDIHVGKERQADESDLNKLVYLQAIVKETLRLYPAAPLSGPREFAEDCTIGGGYHIPKGTRLIPNLWKIHRDPMIWADATAFRPERFLTTQKDIDVKGQHFELIPFGAGRRLCHGIAFGTQMLHLVLARLLQGFELVTTNDALVDMTESAGLSNGKATPLKYLLHLV